MIDTFLERSEIVLIDFSLGAKNYECVDEVQEYEIWRKCESRGSVIEWRIAWKIDSKVKSFLVSMDKVNDMPYAKNYVLCKGIWVSEVGQI